MNEPGIVEVIDPLTDIFSNILSGFVVLGMDTHPPLEDPRDDDLGWWKSIFRSDPKEIFILHQDGFILSLNSRQPAGVSS